jgi:hypothetical protein
LAINIYDPAFVSKKGGQPRSKRLEPSMSGWDTANA